MNECESFEVHTHRRRQKICGFNENSKTRNYEYRESTKRTFLFSFQSWCENMVKLSFLIAVLAFVFVKLAYGKVKVGLDVLKSNDYQAIDGCSLAVLANPTSLLQDFTHIVDDLAKSRPLEMKVILGPEHGFRGNPS